MKEDTSMRYYDVRKQLYLEIDESGIGLVTILLQVRDDLSCRCDEVLVNAVLQPITFASKSLPSAEQWYGNIEKLLDPAWV